MSGAMIIGIDIGTGGALALLTPDGELIEVADMPVLRDGPKNRPADNAPLLADLLWKWHASQAFVEYVGSRPGEGAVGAFAFGRSHGVVEGVLGVCGNTASHITPAAWKRTVGLSLASKDASRAEVIHRWPARAELFVCIKDDGHAEACLIGVTRLMRKGAAR